MVKYSVLEIGGLGAHPLRITECGAVALRNGDQVHVLSSIAERLVAQYAPHVRVVGSGEAAALARGHWQPAGNTPAAEPVAAEVVPPPPPEFAGDNRSMEGKTKTKPVRGRKA